MIVFGASMTSPEAYALYAEGGVQLAREPDSEVYQIQAAGSISRSYNLLMDKAAAFDDLEALVLVHQDVEIVDRDLCAKVRRAIADPAVGAVGCAGVVGATSIAWWEADLVWSSAIYRYGELGGGDMPGMAWRGAPGPVPQPGEVDSLDGMLLVLPAWTVRNIRIDESFSQLHGYDFDLCQQVRAAGRKVVAEDFGIVHHHSLDLVTDNEPWVAAHIRAAEQWEGRIPGREPDLRSWKERARRAEAEAASARLLVAARRLQADAATREHAERLAELAATRSWRLTEPLRRANLRARQVRSLLDRRRTAAETAAETT
jgi:hypothetical protein